MRVYLGSDHAGLDLKAHLVGWLTDQGYEPVDHGPFVYDALDDYPVFCLRAAEAVAAEPGSLGVVIGGSGNGEQMAANKVEGHPLRAGVERGDRGARPRAQRRPGDRVGGRMHTVEEMTVRRDVPGHAVQQEERHVRRIGMLSDYERTGDLPPLPALRPVVNSRDA